MAANSALLFEFNDDQSAALACDTLRELGYETVLHEGSRMHVHLEGSDLTSALEIAQSHGGQLAQQALINADAVTDTAYSLDTITIPAHLVNEDLESLYGDGELPEGVSNYDNDADYEGEFLPDPGTYDHFSGDVRA
ncbi:hypothetical protein BK133_24060 [Paenibacillus sp. FSL H8-0548]|uniref:hypothetical protein n=1 Tax=Paenibacillus sp. FSL H8-0548 TaxID=1920422 RepID=UPI00096E9DA3|nr:hypothetical protein [Paenibacillus sp. FSL H8-0548]OMF23470.1 hypothetical protein BK133_24060 [Paenibacillus sp. FSL H8-0548]